MNILFIDNILLEKQKNKQTKLYNHLGFYFNRIVGKSIYYLNINLKRIDSWIFLHSLKIYINRLLRKEKVYIVLSRNIEDNDKVLRLIDRYFNDYVLVSNQNNLYFNDYLYIDEYIKNNNIKLENIRVLIVIDKLENREKRKIESLIQKYKIVDIYSESKINGLDKYINELNVENGTVVESIDKLTFEYYNIFLVFSMNFKNTSISSFILDYNNSDLDTKSNTYLIYKNNRKLYSDIFKKLGMDILRFEKTKLGKLYIHASGLMLDI